MHLKLLDMSPSKILLEHLSRPGFDPRNLLLIAKSYRSLSGFAGQTAPTQPRPTSPKYEVKTGIQVKSQA